MEKSITVTLNDTDWGQILDGLEERRIVWQATAEYLKKGHTDLSDCIEECSDEHEAQAIAEYYRHLIDAIKRQRESDVDLIDTIQEAINVLKDEFESVINKELADKYETALNKLKRSLAIIKDQPK